MDSILSFIANNSYIIDIVSIILYVVFGSLLFRRSNNKKFFSEVLNNMKYRTEHYIEDLKNVPQGQAFSEVKDVYRLNKVTGELEKTDEKLNVQQLINSCVDVALETVLERFLPQVADAGDDAVGDLSIMRDDLDMMLETSNRAEFYREKYGLSANMSISDIYKFVSSEAKNLQSKLFEASKLKDVADQVKKEIKPQEEQENA